MKKTLYILLLLCSFSACAPNHKNLYTQDSNYLARRQLETRVYDTQDEKEIIIAAAQVLQDMGYTIKESAVRIGLITAEKNREVGSTSGKVALTILAVLGGVPAQYEDAQRIYVNIITAKVNTGVKARVLFSRRTWDNYGNIIKVEVITDKEIYREFFDKLGQSVFLTGHGI